MGTRRYEFCVDGVLTDEARNAFADMRIELVPLQTLIAGEVLDDAHLHGIIAELKTLGFTLVSVRPIP